MLNKDIYNIISREFRASASEEDKTRLNAWLEQTEENKVVFHEMEKVWKLTGSINEFVVVDTDREWNRFKEICDKEQSPKVTPERKLLSSWYMKVAAVLIPLVIVSTIFYFFNGEKEVWKVISTGNAPRYLTLADGSEVWINSKSRFSYPEKFKGKERQVRVLSGEVFFHVSRNGNPFFVETDISRVQVLGTRFNVRALKQSTELIVQEGKVLFSSRKDNAINTILVHGEKAVFHDTSSVIKKEVNANDLIFSWIHQQLVFENTSMTEVAKSLEIYFNKKVKVTSSLDNCLFSGSFQQPTLNGTLDVISTSIGCKYIVSNDTISLYGQGCGH